MKTKLFTHKLLLAGVALATLGLGFTNGAQAQDAYAVSILKITDFTTIFDPLPVPLPDLQGNIVSVTSCSTDLLAPDDNDGDLDAQAFVSLATLPPSLNALAAECGNGNTVRAENFFTPIGPQLFPYGSSDAEIADTNTFGTGEASTIGEAFSNDFTPPIKSFTGNGRNTLSSEFDLTANTKISFDFNAEFMAFAELMGNVNGQALATAASSINIVVTNIDNPAAPVVVADFATDLAPLAPVASKATVVGTDGSLAPTMQHVTVMTPILAAGRYSVEITMESRATVQVDEEMMGMGDHFLCYKSFGKFLREEVNLFDQFDTNEGINFDVLKPKMFCNPAIKPELDPLAMLEPGPHYLSYKINEAHREPRHERKMAEVQNQFGTMIVETFKPDRLMVPSGKSLDLAIPPAIPVPGPNTNHYKCYTVKATGFQSPGDVAVLDQFTDDDGKKLGIVRPTRLCNPVEKTHNGVITPIIEDPNNEFDHLMCYSVRAGAGERLHKKTNVLSNNQFREEKLVLKRELEFCVPTKKTLL
jgi:hypothetical protein